MRRIFKVNGHRITMVNGPYLCGKGVKTTVTAAAALRAFAAVLKDPDNSTSKVWVPLLAPTLKGYDF